MARYDVVVIGAGLGGLTTGAILARAGRKVLVIERSNSVGGAASSYKVGDLFVEGSLHETSDPNDPRDTKHGVLTRAGVLDAVKWIPGGALYQARGGPLEQPLTLPDNISDARRVLQQRFPHSSDGIATLFTEIDHIATAARDLAKSVGSDTADWLTALAASMPESERSLSLAEKFDRVFGDNEAIKCAIAANLSYYHDDPATLSWIYFAAAQGSYLLSGGRYVQGGSQRLSSSLARAVRAAGGEVLIRRVVTSIEFDTDGNPQRVSHTAKDGSDPKTVEAAGIVSNAAPQTLASLAAEPQACILTEHYAQQPTSISLFALTLGLAKPPRSFGFESYSTQLLPPWMTRLRDYAEGTGLMANEPAGRMPPMSVVDFGAIDSGVAAPPHVLSIFGPDRLSNWDSSDMDRYRERRGRWQDAIVAYLDGHFPGLADAVTATSFNTALSVKQYLNAPEGAVYGFAPAPLQSNAPVHRSPRTPISGVYLASAYAGFGGYTGVIQSAGLCAELILRDELR